MYYIYKLVDPRTNIAGYIGITNNLEVRLIGHLGRRDRNDRKNQWIEEIISSNLKIQMDVIETVASLEEARMREKHWIKAHISAGISLYNAQHVLRPSKKALETRTPKPTIGSYQQLSGRAAKYRADYPSELLRDPEYLDDTFADHIDEMQKMDNRVFSEEEIRVELDIHTLSQFITPTSDREEGYIATWYLKHFEKGGRFEEDKPTLKFNH